METTAAIGGPKERVLSMVTQRNLGREVVLRVVHVAVTKAANGPPSSC